MLWLIGSCHNKLSLTSKAQGSRVFLSLLTTDQLLPWIADSSQAIALRKLTPGAFLTFFQHIRLSLSIVSWEVPDLLRSKFL